MSDAFLQSDLTLDIRAALQQVDRLNEALSRATTDVRVTADARAVTAAIDAAVAAAQPDVEVDGDARDVTASIDSAVAAADSDVEVDGDAGRVTGAIDAAVDAADALVDVAGDARQVTAAIDGAVDASDTNVEVTGNVNPRLKADVDDLDESLDSAAASGGRLAAALAGLSAAAIARGLFGLADAASELEQAVGGTEAVFGSSSDIIEAFALTADSAAGLTEQAARTLTSQIGGLLKGFGFTRREAAETSVVLAQLGADLAATFGGRPEEAVEALGAALRGEFNPLERFGVALNVAQINAYAVANGMAASAAEVDLATRANAALQIILERTADAQGQFNRELTTAGGAMAVARAEAGNLSAQAGENLTPALLAVVAALRDDVMPQLGAAADQLLPALADAIIALTPLLGSTTNLLVSLAPAIEAVARIVAMIPAPVIEAAGAFAAVNAAMRAAQWARTTSLVQNLVGTFAGGLGPLRQFRADFIALGSGPAARNLGSSLRSLTTGVSGLTLALGAGFTAMNMYAGMMADSRREGDEWVGTIREQYDLATMSGEELEALARRLQQGARDLRAEMSGGIRGATIDRDFNESLKAGAEGLEEFREEVLEAERALREAEFRADFDPLVDQLVGTSDALDRLRDKAPDVAGQIQSLRLGAEGTSKRFLDLAIALGDATIGEEQMADAARLLGVDVEDLQGIVERANDALDTFVDTAVGNLPTIADAFAATGEDSILSVQEFLAALDESRERMATFRSDLQTLAEAGFADIAGIIAEQGPEVGGALASELVGALETGNVEVLTKVREATTGFQEEWTETSAWYRESLGPEMILQAGLLGEGLTEAFGSNLSFDERLRIAGGLAKLEMSNEGKAVAAIAAAEGERAARDYGDALGLDEETIDEAVKAGRAIRDNAPTADARAAGSATGKAYGEGMESGIFGMVGAVASAAAGLVRSAAARARAEAREASPSRLFAEIGENMALGMAVGMDAETSRVRDSSAALVAAAADAAMSVDRALVAPGFVSGSTAATGGGGTVLQIAQGAVVVSFSGAVSEADARMVGGAVLDGIVDAAFRRQVAVDIRTSRGQVI